MLKTMDTIIETNANKVLALKKAHKRVTSKVKQKKGREKYKHAVGVKKSGRQP